jgi:hypothetical protein
MIKYFCDLCGKEVDELFNIKYDDFADPFHIVKKNKELCRECHKLIIETVERILIDK